jgi:predicted unusual protein kinase regulating ubiquinone biosynthesis (AarF/ABC1/UbiB family)
LLLTWLHQHAPSAYQQNNLLNVIIILQVSQTFAEMMFKHGFVHCDPHAANMLVRPLPSSKASILGKDSFGCKHELFTT